MKDSLPYTAKDIFRLSAKDWLMYGSVIGLARATGMWRYPMSASGDLETMSRLDHIYWLYKAQFPITRAARGSNLEAYFAEHTPFDWGLPSGFEPVGELELSAVGDLMDHPYLPNSADCLYEDVSNVIFGADLAMANLECVIDPHASGPFTITRSVAPPLYYRHENFIAAKGFGQRHFGFMATACNHSLDCGEAGVESTIRTLTDEGISFNGTNQFEKDATAATILERGGFRIAAISHTFGLNAKKPPPRKPWIVNRTHLNGRVDEVDFRQIEDQIRFAREERRCDRRTTALGPGA